MAIYSAPRSVYNFIFASTVVLFLAWCPDQLHSYSFSFKCYRLHTKILPDYLYISLASIKDEETMCQVSDKVKKDNSNAKIL